MTVSREIKGLWYTWPAGWQLVDTSRASHGVVWVAKVNGNGYHDPWRQADGRPAPIGTRRMIYGQ